MKSEIKISNSADVCRIDIEGTIGVPEEWQFDEPSTRVATYEKFRDTVARIADIESPEVVVDIRSTGGDVNDALLIYDALSALDARITTRCYGYTASAATIIAQAASEGCRLISANALYLIHNSSCATEGNAADLEAKVDMLRRTDERLADVYAARSGRDASEFAALMSENGGDGRWLSPDEAVAAGLADAVIGECTETDIVSDAASGSEVSGAASGSRLGSGSARGARSARGVRAAGAAQTAGAADYVAEKWERLRALIGEVLGLRGVSSDNGNGQHPDTSEDRNILHFGDIPTDTVVQTAMPIAFSEGQKRVSPTTVKATEDPSTCDVRRTANDEAYSADARRFARG